MSVRKEIILAEKKLVDEHVGQIESLVSRVSEIILDKKKEIELAVICLLAGGHLLIEDVPGVGKTTLVQALARLTGLKNKRIQFTIDLLPSDILGGPIYNQRDQKFEFFSGPIFSQLILADELNRASPRTQGALLQAMEEYQVSIDGETHHLPKPFFVIATQNPHQQQGTFPLPESQLDRFLMSLELNYPSPSVEVEIFKSRDSREKLAEVVAILNDHDLLRIQNQVQGVKVPHVVAEYVSQLLQNSRNIKGNALPLSTRAGIGLVRAAKANAFLQGRNHLIPDDIQLVIVPVLAHRLGGNYGIRKGTEWAVALQKQTPVPV